MAFLGAEGKLTRFADFGRAAQWLVERQPGLPAKTDPKTDLKPGPKTASRAELPPTAKPQIL